MNTIIVCILGVIVLIAVILIIILIVFAVRYKCACRRSKRVGPITRTPIIPWSQEGLIKFKSTKTLENMIPEARIQCRDVGSGWNTKDCALEKMHIIMRLLFKIKDYRTDNEKIRFSKRNPVPYDARTISIKMDNFKHGLKCHDFIPIDGISPGSYYTYQMFGDNRIQVTNYVEDGVSYVAGFCIYIDYPWSWGICYPDEVIADCIHSTLYPRKASSVVQENCTDQNVVHGFARNEELKHFLSIDVEDEVEARNWLFNTEGEGPSAPFEELSEVDEVEHEIPTGNFSVEYCQKLQRIVITKVESGRVFHQEWNTILNEMKCEECQICTEFNNDRPPTYSSLA